MPSRSGNETYISRVAEINSEPAMFAGLADQTARMLEAMGILISTGLLDKAVCHYDLDGSSGMADCTNVWTVLVERAGQTLAPVLEDPSLFDADALGTILEVLKNASSHSSRSTRSGQWERTLLLPTCSSPPSNARVAA